MNVDIALQFKPKEMEIVYATPLQSLCGDES